MTVIAKIYIKRENQNLVLLNFFKTIIKGDEIFIENFIRKEYYLTIRLSTKRVLDKKKFINDLQREWNLFLKNNESIKTPDILDKASNLFLQYPLGYLSLKEDENTDEKHVLFNSTCTNLMVLEFLEKEKETEEYLMTLFLTYIYVLGGYSDAEIIQLSQKFIDRINFSQQTKKQLDSQIKIIHNESKEFIKNHLEKIHTELQNFYKKQDFPTIASKWKQSYKESYDIGNSNIKQSNAYAIKQFRNQLDVSDSESYFVLRTLINYFSNYK